MGKSVAQRVDKKSGDKDKKRKRKGNERDKK